MSYSVMTAFKDTEIRDKVFDFLKQNFRDIDVVLGDSEQELTYGPCKNEDISYKGETKKPLIGFNYASGAEFYKEYEFQLCYWMAKMAGKKILLKEVNRKNEYIIYDGCEKWFLLKEGEELKNKDYVATDDIGFHKLHRRIYSYLSESEIVSVETKIYNELQRLTNLWKAENTK